MSYSERLLLVVKKMVEDHLARWNPFVGDTTVTIPGEALPPPEKTPYAPAESAFDARKFWARPLQAGAPVQGDGYFWSEEAAAFVLGPVAGGGAEGSGTGFRARLTSNYALSGGSTTLAMSTEDYDTGEHYDNLNYAWTPPAGPVAIIFRTQVNPNSVDITTSIYKNGSDIYTRNGGRYSYDGYGWTETGFMDLANGTDVYTLHVAGDPAAIVVAAGTFWAGIVAGGAGDSPGGEVPLPFVYLVDSDGFYLLDSDGAYLWEYV